MKEELSHTISFLLDNKPVTIDFEKQGLSPATTVLNYLRSLPGHKGVKEGCAEGDCGACTVVLSEKEGNNLKYRAVNSCLMFLPALHGKQLITVESLAVKTNGNFRLHPVQEALVDRDGSQCGYCTPGMVMSMFALYKEPGKPSRDDIKQALAGNLCRCTGYASILKAAEKVCDGTGHDHFAANAEKTMKSLSEIEIGDFYISSSNQQYFKPATLSSALNYLHDHPETIVVNGATDIALRQTRKFERLGSVTDLSAVRELRFFEDHESDIEIGAGLPLEDIMERLSPSWKAFREMLTVFASRQIRNTATLGGNICNASPIGDALPLLFAYNAKVRIIGNSGERLLSLEEFITGYRKTALQEGELLKSIIVPHPENAIIHFYKISKRKDVDISTVSAGFRLGLSEGRVADICLAYGGMAEMPKRAKAAENFLLRKQWTPDNAAEAAQIIKNKFSPISDARSGKEFRRTVAGNLLLRFYQDIQNGSITA